MKKDKITDKELAAMSSSSLILAALVYYWATEVSATIELLELAYGSFKLFNNPLVF